MHDFELIQSFDYAKDVINSKAIWYEGNQQLSVAVVIPQEYKTLPDYTYRVKCAFASHMQDYPEALKKCLLTLDQIFGMATPVFEDIYYSDSDLAIKSFVTDYEISSESEYLWDVLFGPPQFAKGGSISMNFKLSAGQFNNLKNVMSASTDFQEKSLSRSSYKLPGVQEYVKFPCGKHYDCKNWILKPNRLHNTIMKLNDSCKWTREEIADWLDSISDPTGINGPDLTFKTNTKEIENVES